MAFVQTEGFDTPFLESGKQVKAYKILNLAVIFLRLYLLHSTVKSLVGGDGDLLHVLEILRYETCDLVLIL